MKDGGIVFTDANSLQHQRPLQTTRTSHSLHGVIYPLKSPHSPSCSNCRGGWPSRWLIANVYAMKGTQSVQLPVASSLTEISSTKALSFEMRSENVVTMHWIKPFNCWINPTLGLDHWVFHGIIKTSSNISFLPCCSSPSLPIQQAGPSSFVHYDIPTEVTSARNRHAIASTISDKL